MKIIKTVKRKFQNIYNRNVFKKNKVDIASDFTIKGYLFVRNEGQMHVGNNFRANSGKNYNIIGGDHRTNIIVSENGKLVIGNNVGMSNGSIYCSNNIKIGDNVLLGGGVKIYDTDFHSIKYEERMKSCDRGLTRPVTIGEGAFIGAHTIILKGVTIGDRSVVGAGSVVTKNIPPNEVWAGNPVKFIKKITVDSI